MMRIVYVQAPILEELLEKLKKKSGCKSTKDAVTIAIEHYIKCKHVGEDKCG